MMYDPSTDSHITLFMRIDDKLGEIEEGDALYDLYKQAIAELDAEYPESAEITRLNAEIERMRAEVKRLNGELTAKLKQSRRSAIDKRFRALMCKSEQPEIRLYGKLIKLKNKLLKVVSDPVRDGERFNKAVDQIGDELNRLLESAR